MSNQIFTVDAKHRFKQLTRNSYQNNTPSWSRDGKRIAWTMAGKLCTMNADGSNQKKIGYGNDPSWSISDEIVFSHANANYSKEVLYIVNADGSGKRQITF